MAVAARSRAVLVAVLSALFVGLLSAVAVDLGFGPGFVDDVIAYPAVVYSCWVSAVVARSRSGGGGGPRVWIANLLCNGSIGAIVLVVLRTVARFDLPVGKYTTTGHYPYFAIPVACTLGQLVWELIGKRNTNRAPEVNA